MFLYARFPAARTKDFHRGEARAENPLPTEAFGAGGRNTRLGVRRSWRAGADCKSVGLSLRWFESTHSHQNINTRHLAGVYILRCGIRIRPYNRQIVWFGTSASARSERGPPQFCGGNYNPAAHQNTNRPLGRFIIILLLVFFLVFGAPFFHGG